MEKLTTFEFGGSFLPVEYVETQDVAPGVSCDVYRFTIDLTKDLGIIDIVRSETPSQLVLYGEQTIEKFRSGKGSLTVSRADGWVEFYPISGNSQVPLEIEVCVGDKMQWKSAIGGRLTASEICIPPYEEGRYKNL